MAIEKRNIIVLLSVILLVQTVLAGEDKLTWDNCENIVKDIPCPEIPPDILNNSEKEILLEMLTFNETKPVHDFIREWNSEIVFDGVPDDVTSQNHLTIKDAWLKLYTVMPSVEINKTIYNDNIGDIFSGYYYSLSIPSNYYNGKETSCGEPGNTNGLGDCKTIYGPNWDESIYGISQNNILLGSEKVEDFISAPENEFTSDLKIVNKIQRERWKWKIAGCCRTCCSESGCYCCAREYICKFSTIDYRYDTLNLKDTLETEKIPESIHSFFDITIDDTKIPHSAYVELATSNIEIFILYLGDRSFSYRNYDYNINYSSVPFNVLQIYTFNNTQPFGNKLNLVYVKETDKGKLFKLAFTGDPGECSITTKNPFGAETHKCTYNIMEETKLKISTDKASYIENDDIQLTIEFSSNNIPSQGKINIIYGEDVYRYNVNGKLTTTLKTKETDYIKAYFNTDHKRASSENRVFVVVKPKGRWKVYLTIVFSLLTFWGLLYIFKRTILLQDK